MDSFKVNSQFGNYQISFPALSSFEIEADYIPIVDRNVWNIYKDKIFFKKIKSPILINAIEAEKSLGQIEVISNELILRGVQKRSHLLAIGGGITQELVSFVASIYFRGINWSFIPTTLLSQADSCIGGKNSLNLNGIKNVLGTFNPPNEIFVFKKFLETLSKVDLLSGKMEMIKIHLISGVQNYKKLSENLTLEKLLYASMLLKKQIVERDELDKGDRWKLNLGHTMGHALETVLENQYPHGICIGLGMLMELEIAKEFEYINDECYQQIYQLLWKELEDYKDIKINKDALLKAFSSDKKHSAEDFKLILFSGLGEVQTISINKKEEEKIFNAALSFRH